MAGKQIQRVRLGRASASARTPLREPTQELTSCPFDLLPNIFQKLIICRIILREPGQVARGLIQQEAVAIVSPMYAHSIATESVAIGL